MADPSPRELAILDEASRILAGATTLEQIKTIRDKAQAAKTYAKAARMGLELQNKAAELKLRAEREAGRFLRALRLRGGDRKSAQRTLTVKLEDFGISRDQSKRWQHIAAVSEETFSEYLRTMREQKREVTSAGLLRIARKGHGQSANRPRQRGSSVPSLAAPDILDELSNHCQLLGNILRPIVEGRPVELKNVERRLVGRLIADIERLVKQIKGSSSAR